MVKLYAPGTRKRNLSYVARGSVAGRQYEITTHATDKAAARRVWDAFEAKVAEQGAVARPGTPRTFSGVAEAYRQARRPSRDTRRYLARLETELGELDVADITPLDIAQAAARLYPTARNETRNRQAYAPAAAVLHFAAEAGLRDYLVVRKLPEREPESRRPDPNTPALLLANTTGPQHLLLTVLFHQGWRITETLGLRWRHVDLQNRLLALYVAKSARWKTVAMHDAVFEALASIPRDLSAEALAKAEGGGGPERVFPWADRHQVYNWLRPLCKRLGVRFTPHMARHAFASALSEAGATDHDLVDVGSWTSHKSIRPYRHTAPDHHRRTLAKLAWGESNKKDQNNG